MNVARFAGEDKAMQQMAKIMAENDARMAAVNQQAFDNILKQRARDVAATGVKNPGAYL